VINGLKNKKTEDKKVTDLGIKPFFVDVTAYRITKA
jgi:hypothetical protein